MDNAQKLAILPMWVIERIKEEMRLSPATWQTIMAAVEQAEVPQILPCEVKLPPGTVIGKGVPVSTLMMAIAQRERYPVHAQAFSEQHQGEPTTFQARVQPWLMACFGEMIAGDRKERNHRFLEEALELVQSLGCSAAEAHQLVEYVFGRQIGEPSQEVGGVMVTLAALCLANSLDMHQLAEIELARIWTKVDAIRAKQASKPQFGPLPGAYPGREPTPKCGSCKGHGVIGWRRGQTAESYEEGESPCEDCNATGYAHSNGMPVSGACTTCNGLGIVPDGEITGLDGVEFENGPVECVKDCPDCGSGPDALTDLATWKRRAIEAESKLRTYDPQVVELGEQAMQSLLANPKPNELMLTKCRLCDQLQADLTERDQRIDQFEQVMQKVATLRGTLEQHGLREEVEALLWAGLHSRPEERGTPATEPCSGCGTLGWTGACSRCTPY